MYTHLKRVGTMTLLALFSLFAVLPAMSYEMDFFPKFDAKKHFYVQKGSVSPNMNDAFFAEMEQRLDSIEKKYGAHMYFICANSDETTVEAISSSASNYGSVLWMEWEHQGMPTSKTAIIVLGGNNADNPAISKFRYSSWFDSDWKLPYLDGTGTKYTSNASSLHCLEERNCPHQFVRAVTLHLEDECKAKYEAEVASKEAAAKAAAAQKKAQEEAAAKAAEDAKIQAARASDGGVGNVNITAAIAGIESIKRECDVKVKAFDQQVLLMFFGGIAVCGILGWLVIVSKK